MTDPLVHLLQRHASAVDDILELRHALECVAAYFAAQRATEADAKRLCDMAAAMKRRRSVRKPLEDADLDVDFHMAVAEASHNLALVHVMRGIFNLMRINMLRAREALYHDHDNVILLDDQHGAIVKAIVDRDPVAARTAANLHLGFIQTSLREAAASPVRKRATRRRQGEAPMNRQGAAQVRACRSTDALGPISLRTQTGHDLLHMHVAARLQLDLDLGALERQPR